LHLNKNIYGSPAAFQPLLSQPLQAEIRDLKGWIEHKHLLDIWKSGAEAYLVI